MDKIEFETLIHKESKKILNYLLKMVRNYEDAEDLLQETLLSFYKKSNNVNPDYYTSYLFKTAYHKAINHIHKKKRKKELSVEDFHYLKAPPDEKDGTNDENSEKVIKAMAKLSIKDATILDLQFYQKKSYQEISDIMGISVKAVDSRLVRAKKRLRKFFLQENPDKPV